MIDKASVVGRMTAGKSLVVFHDRITGESGRIVLSKRMKALRHNSRCGEGVLKNRNPGL